MSRARRLASAGPTGFDGAPLWLRWRATISKLLRYGAVSVVCTVLSVSALAALVWAAAIPVAWANLAVVTVMILPSFILSKRWVWPHRGNRHRAAELIPFAVASVLAVTTSTVGVHLVGGWTSGWARSSRTAVVVLTDLGIFGCLWLVQFVFNDAFVFRGAGRPQRRVVVDADEGHEQHNDHVRAVIPMPWREGR